MFHCYNMRPTPKSHRIHLLSFFVLIFFIIYDGTVTMTNYYIYPESQFPCKWQVYMSINAYLICKVSLSYLYLERLFIVFSGSDLQFSNKFMLITRIFLFIILISAPILFLIINNELGRIDEFGECFSAFPAFLNYSFAALDTFVSIMILILFSRRLLMLSLKVQQTAPTLQLRGTGSTSIQSRKDTNQSIFGNDKRLLSVVKKTTILTMVAVTTSLSSYVVSYFGLISMWVAIDTSINSWCVLLLFAKYHELYEKICYGMTYCLNDKCLAICACYCLCKKSLIKKSTIVKSNGYHDHGDIDDDTDDDEYIPEKRTNNINSYKPTIEVVTEEPNEEHEEEDDSL